MKKIESFFLSNSARLDEKEYRLATLQINFSVISILFAIGYWLNTFLTGFVVARYMMVISTVLFTAQLFGMKAGLSRSITSHVFVIICWGIVFILTLFSGGIASYVLGWISLIPILALLLLNHKVAWVWGSIGLGTVFFFYFIDQQIPLPVHLVHHINKQLMVSLNIGLLFIILILTYVFDQQQALLLTKISELYKIANTSREEIAAQNEELVQSQEEILAQRDLLSEQNSKLREARSVIEDQNEKIKLQIENLETEVEKRTHELVEYNRQLEQFTFISSHNLRAPVARILGLGNLLELPSKSAEDTMFIITNLIGSARELDRVVKDLNTILDVKKNSTSVITDIDLTEELKLVLTNLENEIIETNAKIITDLSYHGSIQGIRPYLDSIIINLISNAIKYRDPLRSPVIQVRTEMAGRFVKLIIKDNGLGIDLTLHREKLFTLYSRFHTHVEGKGLGLYLIKSQVTAMGGKIEVESIVNTGTEFTVYFKATSDVSS